MLKLTVVQNVTSSIVSYVLQLVSAMSLAVASEIFFFNLTTNYTKESQIFRVTVHNFLTDLSNRVCLKAVIKFFLIQSVVTLVIFFQSSYKEANVLFTFWNRPLPVVLSVRLYEMYEKDVSFLHKLITFSRKRKEHLLLMLGVNIINCAVPVILLSSISTARKLIIFTCNLSCVIVGAVCIKLPCSFRVSCR